MKLLPLHPMRSALDGLIDDCEVCEGSGELAAVACDHCSGSGKRPVEALRVIIDYVIGRLADS